MNTGTSTIIIVRRHRYRNRIVVVACVGDGVAGGGEWGEGIKRGIDDDYY